MRILMGIAGSLFALSACADKLAESPLYVGMTTQHFLRAACDSQAKHLMTLDDVDVYDCARDGTSYGVEIRSGAVINIHSPKGDDPWRIENLDKDKKPGDS